MVYPEKAKLDTLHIIILKMLRAWRAELKALDIDKPEFNAYTRLPTLTFLACDRMRHMAGRKNPVVPTVGITALDWLTDSLIKWPQFDQAQRLLLDRGFMRFHKSNKILVVTEDGKKAIEPSAKRFDI